MPGVSGLAQPVAETHRARQPPVPARTRVRVPHHQRPATVAAAGVAAAFGPAGPGSCCRRSRKRRRAGRPPRPRSGRGPERRADRPGTPKPVALSVPQPMVVATTPGAASAASSAKPIHGVVTGVSRRMSATSLTSERSSRSSKSGCRITSRTAWRTSPGARRSVAPITTSSACGSRAARVWNLPGPSGSTQCAPVRTNSGWMSTPPQRKPSRLSAIAAALQSHNPGIVPGDGGLTAHDLLARLRVEEEGCCEEEAFRHGERVSNQ